MDTREAIAANVEQPAALEALAAIGSSDGRKEDVVLEREGGSADRVRQGQRSVACRFLGHGSGMAAH
jgi:hypothetical protein